jgi:cytochrome P450
LNPNWKKHRKLLQPAFGPSHLRNAAFITREIMDMVDAKWQLQFDLEQKKSITVDMHQMLTAITMDVM